jgi:hypothetical protein
MEMMLAMQKDPEVFLIAAKLLGAKQKTPLF